MQFVIELLKEKKKEIEKEFEGILEVNRVKYFAHKTMTDQIDNAVKTLEYEYYWKHLNEKRIDEVTGIEKDKIK